MRRRTTAPDPALIDTASPVDYAHPLNQGLVSWWLPLPTNQGSGTLFDIAGRNHGTLTNGPTWVPGTNGFGAVKFDGTNNRCIDCGIDPPGAVFGTNPYAVEVWFKPAVLSGRRTLVRSDSFSGGAGNFWLLEQGDGNNFSWFPCAFSGSQQNVGTGMVVNQWGHLVGVRDAAGNSIVYFNGLSVASTTGATAAAGGSGNPLRFGNSIPGSSLFSGAIGGVRIHSRALSATEVAALYEQTLRGHPDTLRRLSTRVFFLPTEAPPAPPATSSLVIRRRTSVPDPALVDIDLPVDYAHPLNQGLVSWWLPLPTNRGGGTLFDIAGRNHGTLTNGPTWVPGTNGFGAVRYTTSATMYADTAATVSGTPGFTVTAHLRAITYGTGGGGYNDPFAFIGSSYHFPSVDAGGTIAIWGSGSSVGAYPTDGFWHVLTWVHAAGNDTVYIDGKVTGTTTSTHTNADPLRIGGRSDYAQSWDGPVSACFLHSRPLSASEVAALYDQTLRGHPDTLRRLSTRAYSFGPPAATTASMAHLPLRRMRNRSLITR